MELLKERILKDSHVINGQIIDADSFLNHQVDPVLIEEIASEFVYKLSDLRFNKILAAESSGAAPAILTGVKLSIPVILAKRSIPANRNENFFSEPVHSRAECSDYNLSVMSKFIKRGDSFLIINDFLSTGSASRAMIGIVEQGGAKVAGIGVIIEKSFQNGGNLLREMGYKVISLTTIDNIDNKKIHFR